MPNFELTHTGSFTKRAKTIIDSSLVNARLAELSSDLSTSLFHDVIFSGLGARNEATHASATTAAGIKQWLQTVETLRTLLGERNWRIHDHKNCPFISSSDQRISIVVMTGNLETGRIGFEDPTNQAEKGSVAEDLVNSNRQLQLFNRDAFNRAKNNSSGTEVWAFLYHYDKALKEVRYELSYPTGFDKKKITSWDERIIIGNTPNNPADFTPSQTNPVAPAIVEVMPKTGSF